MTAYSQDSIGGTLKLGLLNTLGKIDVILDCANENRSDEHVPDTEVSKSVISEHVACSPDASLGLKGLSPIPVAGLGGAANGAYGRVGGSFDAYDASLLDRLHEFQQKPKQEVDAPACQSQSAGGGQAAAPAKAASTSFQYQGASISTISPDAAYPSNPGLSNDLLLCILRSSPG